MVRFAYKFFNRHLTIKPRILWIGPFQHPYLSIHNRSLLFKQNISWRTPFAEKQTTSSWWSWAIFVSEQFQLGQKFCKFQNTFKFESKIINSRQRKLAQLCNWKMCNTLEAHQKLRANLYWSVSLTVKSRQRHQIIIIIIIISTFINSARVTQCHNGAGWRQRLSSAHQMCL